MPHNIFENESSSVDNMSDEEKNAYFEALEEAYASQIVEISWPLKDFLSKFRKIKKLKFCHEFYSETGELEDAILLKDIDNKNTVVYNLNGYSYDNIMHHMERFIIELRKSGHFMLNHNELEAYKGVTISREGKLWGCFNNEGKVLIPFKYDTISFVFFNETRMAILCGRNGNQYTGYIKHKRYCEDISFETLYTGVYDLYDINGQLLIGGFIDYKYIESYSLFQFKYGQNYRLYDGDGTENSPYYFKQPYGNWILLNSQFCFINAYSYFKNESLCWITENRTNVQGSIFENRCGYLQGNVNSEDKIGDKITIRNVLYSDIECKNSSTILCKRGSGRASSYCILNLCGAFFTSFYEWIEVLDNTYSYVYEKGVIGLLKKGFTAIPCKYSYITHPIDGWCFAAIKYPYTPNPKTWQKYYVILCNVEKNRYDAIAYKKIIVAIDYIDEDTLQDLLYYGGLLLYKRGNDKEISSFSISKKYKFLFREDFINLLNPQFHDEKYEHTNYYESAWRFKNKIEDKCKINSIHDSYSLMDALDGDASAYWNIE